MCFGLRKQKVITITSLLSPFRAKSWTDKIAAFTFSHCLGGGGRGGGGDDDVGVESSSSSLVAASSSSSVLVVLVIETDKVVVLVGVSLFVPSSWSTSIAASNIARARKIRR